MSDVAPPPPPLARAATYVPPQVIDSLNKMEEEQIASASSSSSSSSSLSSSTATSSSSSSSSSSVKYPVTEMWGGGRKGAKQYQEDSWLTFSSSSHRVIVAGVFDGHGGYNGMVASQTARDLAHKFFATHDAAQRLDKWDEATWKQQLLHLFDHMHDGIRQKFVADPSSSDEDSSSSSSSSSHEKRYIDEAKIVRSSSSHDPIHGGTTCTIVVQIRGLVNDHTTSLITANVGDSTALVLPARSACSFLSVDHGPENSDEFARIAALPSDKYPLKLLLVYDKTTVFRKYECPSVFRPDGVRDPIFVNNPWANGLHPTNVRYEPAVYAVTPRAVSRDSTCIAMTRALGDFYAHQFGLTAVPDITVRHVDTSSNERHSVVLASDGIWDCWRYDDFANFCNTQFYDKKLSLSQMGKVTLDESINRAIENFGAKHYDDACLVCWSVN